ncbi:MAG: SWIM zinc finger family protein [Pseudomonadota bacterium]
MKAKKWPVRARSGSLVWREWQGAGANPYRTVFDSADMGYKCTCPSRKLPCKHAHALMWMYVEDPRPFAEAEMPDWFTDWLGRRRRLEAAAAPASGNGKSMVADRSAEPA